ncbi:MAG: sel1 repeat family protein [Salinarimonadaceae bacterium]|nr:MAG: sel1 repeat family protein [Salinarimonadaceae bacterium]
MADFFAAPLCKARVAIHAVLFAGSLLCSAVAYSQAGLPPEVQRDLIVAALERALDSDNYEEALRQIDRLRAIVPDETKGELLFFEAFAAVETEDFARAEEALNAFLVNPGNTSPRYNAALQLMLDMEEIRQEAEEQAIGPLRRGCEGGNARDCAALGWRYDGGLEGVPQNAERAAFYYREGCEKGHAVGCSNLGIMYENGNGIARNFNQAMTFFKRSCDLGYGRGCGLAGRQYQTGTGRTVDLVTAARYYREGCTRGDSRSCDQRDLLPREARETSRAVSVPASQCLIVVASRRNREEVDEFIDTMPINLRPSIRLFEASNGWLAISIGAVSRDQAKERIDREIAGNRIPDDSFCANPERFPREIVD